jgi:hypothetical protein
MAYLSNYAASNGVSVINSTKVKPGRMEYVRNYAASNGVPTSEIIIFTAKCEKKGRKNFLKRRRNRYIVVQKILLLPLRVEMQFRIIEVNNYHITNSNNASNLKLVTARSEALARDLECISNFGVH